MYGAKPGDASMDNPRCDVLITRGQKHAVFPQKLAVGTQLSKLVGWDRPTEVRLARIVHTRFRLGRSAEMFEGRGLQEGDFSS